MRWDLVALGEAMIELQTTECGLQLTRSLGGDTLNALAMAQALGARTAFQTCIAEDLHASYYRDFIGGRGIDLALAKPIAGFNGLYFIQTDAGGERSFQYYRQNSAASCLSPADVETAPLEEAQIVYASGITQALSQSAGDAVEHAFAKAKRHGRHTAYDINFRPALWREDVAVDRLRALLPMIDILFLSEADAGVAAKALGAAEATPQALIAAATGGGVPGKVTDVVVKLGAAGAIGARRDEDLPAGTPGKSSFTAIPAPSVKCLDTSGAGDTFNGAFLVARSRGLALADAMRWGATAAALKVTRRGTVCAQPTAAELAAALATA